jgi:hypothetical protein
MHIYRIMILVKIKLKRKYDVLKKILKEIKNKK